jgi:hypothetical protein
MRPNHPGFLRVAASSNNDVNRTLRNRRRHFVVSCAGARPVTSALGVTFITNQPSFISNSKQGALMTELDKVITENYVLTTAIAEALVSKGVISKDDLLNSLTTLEYESPVPKQVFLDLQKQIAGLPSGS